MDEAYIERVLSLVESIPAARVLPYGRIAEHLGAGYGPRYVGRIMSTVGHTVCWWRVPRADGTLAQHLMLAAQRHWVHEGTPVRNGRVLIAEAIWDPESGR